MPPVGAASVPEMTAAAALLELCSDSRKNTTDAPTQVDLPQNESPPQLESTATDSISMQNFIVTRVTDSSTPKSVGISSPTIIKLPGGGYIIRNNPNSPVHHKNVEPMNRKRLNLHKKYQDEQRRWSKDKAAKPPKVVKRFRDASTQTETEYQLPQIERMESFIKELSDKIKNLESQLESARKSGADGGESDEDDDEDEDDLTFDNSSSARKKYTRRAKNNSSSNSFKLELPSENSSDDSEYKIENERGEDMELSDESLTDEEEHYNKLRKAYVSSSEMVPIGDGNAVVPSRLLKQLDWSSYTNATRKLLTAVFSRRVLATHSLTGKPSPAFPDKPAKKKLDAALVNDIVQTVVERCKVPENVVRTSITTKCADESKMLRSRQQNKKKNYSLCKKENIPPRSSGSEGSMNS